MRQSLRGLVNHLTQIGIPSGRVALEMQLTTSPGPRPARRPPAAAGLARDREARGARREVRRDAVQARRASGRGAGRRSTRTSPPIPTRPPRRASGCGRATSRSATARPPPATGFDASLTEGQLDVPAGARCLTSAGSILRNAVAPLHRRSPATPATRRARCSSSSRSRARRRSPTPTCCRPSAP